MLRVRGMPEDVEVAVTLAMSYLVYYVTNAPLHLSGVIAVVVFGLYGSATLKVRTPPLPPASPLLTSIACMLPSPSALRHAPRERCAHRTRRKIPCARLHACTRRREPS